jgi:anthranilate/para-aminobenzoate synthase component I
MSTKNVYKIGKIHQLFDLSTDSLNFICNFKIQAETSDNEFEFLVVSQEQLDGDDKLQFNKVKGIGSGKIVADKSTPQNLFLALKSTQDITVTVDTKFEKLPDTVDNTSAHNFISSETYTGPISGMVFQSGSQGNGYYPDPNLHVPTESMHTPSESMQTPTESMHTPTESMHTSTESMHTSTESMQTPTESMQTPTDQQNYTKYVEQLQQEQLQGQLQQGQLQEQFESTQVENPSFFSNMLNNKYVWIISGIVLVIILWYIFSSRSNNSEDSNTLKHPEKPKTSNTKLSLDNLSVTNSKKSGSKNKLNIDKLNSLM